MVRHPVFAIVFSCNHTSFQLQWYIVVGFADVIADTLCHLFHVFIPLHFHRFRIKSLMQFLTLQKLTVGLVTAICEVWATKYYKGWEGQRKSICMR